MTKDIVCIYHGDCADGFAAAWVVRRYFGEKNVTFHAGYHGNKPPEVKGKQVIIVDFSYPKETLIEMAKKAKSILVLDHHQTAEEDLKGFWTVPKKGWDDYICNVNNLVELNHPPIDNPNIHVLFDKERSGAGITWDFFFPRDLRPPLIDHVEDRDLWRFHDPRTRPFMAYLLSFPFSFETWDRINNKTEDSNPDYYVGILRRGHCILRARQKIIDDLVDIKNLLPTIFLDKYSVPTLNVPYMFASDVGNALLEKYSEAPLAATYWINSGGKCYFSLRSRKGSDVDVSEIAKEFGGGGHKHAAGFQVEAKLFFAGNYIGIK